MFQAGSRDKETTLKCPKCDNKLHICRSCTEVHMRCPVCGKNYPLQEYIGKADQAMESFLENVYFDRI